MKLARLRAHRGEAALLVFVLLLFARAIAGRGVFFQRDVTLYWLPQVESLLRVLATGSLPVWNPYFAVGLPLLADPGYQVFYPPQWLNVLLGPGAFYTLFIVGHALFSAIGASRLARAWGLDPTAGAAAGACWVASGPFLSLVSNNPQFAGAAWIPWVLLGLEHALRAPTLACCARLAAAAALQLLAGSGDFVVMTAYLCVLRVALFLGRGDGTLLARLRPLVRTGLIAGSLALLLAGALWVPALALARTSGRAQMDAVTAASWSIHPLSLVDLFVAQGVAGLPVTAEARAALFHSREPFLASLYLGAAAAGIAPLALAGARRRGALLLAAAALFVVIALGSHTLLFGAVRWLPGVAMFRYPAKYAVPAALLWALLVGLAVHVLGEGTAPPRRLILLATAGAALVASVTAFGAAAWFAGHPAVLAGIAQDAAASAAALAQRIRISAAALGACGAAVLACGLQSISSRRAALIVSILIAMDLAVGARDLNPLAPPELFTARPALLRSMPSRGDGFPTRVMSLLPGIGTLNRRLVRGPAGWDREWSWMLGLQDALVAPSSARWGLGGAFDGDFTALGPAVLGQFSLVAGEPRLAPLTTILLRAGSVDYVATLDPRGDGLVEVTHEDSVFDAPLRLYRVPDPAPRVYLAAVQPASDESEAWREFALDGFDPARTAVVVGGTATPADPQGRVTVSAHRPDRVEIQTDATLPALLVFTEMRAPGWTATLDGGDVPLVSANLMFCGVPVPAGRHRVVFEFHAPGARAGLALTLAGLVAAALCARPRRDPSCPGPAESTTIDTA